jgi:hypothetical protein
VPQWLVGADVTNEMDRLKEGRSVIERTYRAIWNDWFERMGIPRSYFCVTDDCVASGYRPQKDELLLSLPELNVEEASDDLMHARVEDKGDSGGLCSVARISLVPSFAWQHRPHSAVREVIVARGAHGQIPTG